MNRCVVLVGRMLVVVAIVMSFAVARPGAAEGLNSLTFSFAICPESEDICTPYGNTDARIMDLATGIEQWATNDAQGLVTFSGLADGQFAFSVPSVQQKSISITCGDDATGMIVGSQMGDNGPQVGLAGGQSITCSGVMIPFGPSDVHEAPVDAGVDVPETGFVESFIYECPAGAEGQDLNTLCDSPSQSYTAFLTSGTVTNQSTVEQETGSNGAASFEVTPGDVSLWPGTDSATQTIVSVSCTAFVGGNDGPPVGSDFTPDLGGSGYEVSVAPGQTVDCFFSVVIEAEPVVVPIDSAVLSVYTSECPVGYTGSDYASDCGNPADASIYTAYVHSGGVPNLVTLESALNAYGYTSFDGLAADHYSVMVGSESATVGAVSCEFFDASGSGEGTSIEPNLGGSGYELDLVEGGSADCFFAMIPTGAATPSDAPSASDRPAASATARPSAPASSSTATTISLPNTGTGAASGSVQGTTVFALIGLLLGSVSLLLVALGLRRPTTR